MMDKYYVYKFSKGDEILYIGRTNNITRRFSSHSGTDFFNESDKFEFMEFDNSVDHVISELYLINKHKPKYNVASNNDDTPTGLNIELPPFKDASKMRVIKNKNHPLNIIREIARNMEKLKRREGEEEFFINNGFENYPEYLGIRDDEFQKGWVGISFINSSKNPRYSIVVEAYSGTPNEFTFYEECETPEEAYKTIMKNVPAKYMEGDENIKFHHDLKFKYDYPGYTKSNFESLYFRNKEGSC